MKKKPAPPVKELSASYRVLSIYQYLAPALLAPMSFMLWMRSSGENIRFSLIAWGIPVSFAYIVPGVGTNVLKLWEFKTRFRLGRFRPHHGFVFGSATSALAWACISGDVISAAKLPQTFQAAFVLASVLGFWNMLYDALAIRCGFLIVYNRPWAEGKSPEAVAADYAPWVFGGFGFAYGLSLGIAAAFAEKTTAPANVWGLFAALLALCIVLPVGGYMVASRIKYGDLGLRPASPSADSPEKTTAPDREKSQLQ